MKLRDVEDPQTGVSVADRRRARIEVNGSSQARDELQRRSDLRISRWVPVLIIRRFFSIWALRR